ncbi:hypothetical protein AALM99_06335 [Lactococcus muris]|uniref:Uncharacterized protein n=1 Tax=Lactococcus muris TaxID=2941330 RepID=A0ABV4D8H9_9LACT|nr:MULTISPECIES: hypothetical protein [Lactococcus]
MALLKGCFSYCEKQVGLARLVSDEFTEFKKWLEVQTVIPWAGGRPRLDKFTQINKFKEGAKSSIDMYNRVTFGKANKMC